MKFLAMMPSKQRNNKDKYSALICTVGTSTPVVTETLKCLTHRKIKIDRILLIHTSSEKVIKSRTKSGKDIGLSELKKYIKRNYAIKKIQMHQLNIAEIISEEDNLILIQKLLKVISLERSRNKYLYISIAGGYKTMSALSLFVSYLFGCEGIYHVLVKGDEAKLTDKYLFDIPLKYLTLVELPKIDLSRITQSILREVDPKNSFKGDFYKYIISQGDIGNVFNIISEKLKNFHSYQSYKNTFEKIIPKYQKLAFTIESMLRVRAEERKIKPLRFESRAKSLESFFDKIDKKGYSSPFEQTEDLAGTRIISYFQEDANKIIRLIQECGDFVVIQSETKEGSHFGYTAHHFVVKLAYKRTRLIEYKELRNLKCEIQVTTIYDHAHAQPEHQFRYKSKDYDNLSLKDKKRVDEIFSSTNKFLEKSKKEVSKLLNIYNGKKNKGNA